MTSATPCTNRRGRRKPRIGIVGGGASGALIAIHLLRRLRCPTEIVVVEQTGEFGPGVPYRTRNPEHRLNVPAARMSALADEPDHFLEWLRTEQPKCRQDNFAPRGVYADYLVKLLAEAELEADSGVELKRVTGKVSEIEPSGSGLNLILDGWRTKVDQVVLAVGLVSGGDPVPVPESLKEKGIYIPEAWDEAAVLPARGDRNVLVIGSGLTMIDVALTLTAGHEGPKIKAISRNGLIPRAHRTGLTKVATPPIPPEGEVSIRDLLAAFTGELVRSSLEGGDWRDAIDSMRSVTPDAWRRLPTDGKKWFITHMNRVWEIHRYRMAPEVAARFNEITSNGRLTVDAARIGKIEDAGSRARVTLISKAGAEIEEFDRVISCCGASTDITEHPPAPFADLFATGQARPDELKLGVDVDPDGVVRKADGERSANISLIGALRRGVEWEAIGITELRKQAATIADRLVTEIGSEQVAEAEEARQPATGH